jgi:hypothetical protein
MTVLDKWTGISTSIQTIPSTRLTGFCHPSGSERTDRRRENWSWTNHTDWSPSLKAPPPVPAREIYKKRRILEPSQERIRVRNIERSRSQRLRLYMNYRHEKHLAVLKWVLAAGIGRRMRWSWIWVRVTWDIASRLSSILLAQEQYPRSPNRPVNNPPGENRATKPR